MKLLKRMLCVMLTAVMVITIVPFTTIKADAGISGISSIKTLELKEREYGEIYLEASVDYVGDGAYTLEVYYDDEKIGYKTVNVGVQDSELVNIEVTDNDLDKYHMFEKGKKYSCKVITEGAYESEFISCLYPIEITANYFIDEELRRYIIDNFDIDKDNYLSLNEIEGAKEIVNNYYDDEKYTYVCTYDIHYLNGIDYFYNLETLDISDLQDKDLDLSELKKLSSLAITCINDGNSILENLNIMNNRNLKTFGLSGSGVKGVSFVNNPYIESIVVSVNPALGFIKLGENKFIRALINHKNGMNSKSILDIKNTSILTSGSSYGVMLYNWMLNSNNSEKIYVYCNDAQKEYLDVNFSSKPILGKDKDKNFNIDHNKINYDTKQPAIYGYCGVSADHSFIKYKEKQPTCTKAGTREYSICTNCFFLVIDDTLEPCSSLEKLKEKLKKDKYVAPTGKHNMVEIPGRHTSCLADDNYKSYYKCKTCFGLYEDVEGKKRITDLEEWKKTDGLLPIGHNLEGGSCHEKTKCKTCGYEFYNNDIHGDDAWEEYCIDKDFHCLKCKYCGARKDNKGHSHINVLEVPATCTTYGVKKYYYCWYCDAFFDTEKNLVEDIDAWKNDGTKGRIDKTAHSYNTYLYDDDEHWKVCDDCFAISECSNESHSYSGGLCISCKKVQSASCGGHHIGGASLVGKPATCTTDGIKDFYECSGCGKYFEYKDGAGELSGPIENIMDWIIGDGKIPATGHKGGIATCIKYANCTECGQDYGTLADHEYEEGYSFNKTGHYKRCKNCSYNTSIEEHKEVIKPGKAPTCTELGLTDAKQCEICGYEYQESEIIAPTGHVEEIIPGKDATCIESGITNGKKCKVCGLVTLEQKEITKLPHTEIAVEEKQPTCTENGHTEGKQCSVCGQIITGMTEIPALGHKWEDGDIIKLPTYEEDGEQAIKCCVCQTVDKKVIDKVKGVEKQVNIGGKIYTLILQVKDTDGMPLAYDKVADAVKCNGKKVSFAKAKNMKIDGYSLKGWYIKSGTKNKKVSTITSKKIEDKMIVSAVFNENKYTVKYKITKPLGAKVKGKIAPVKNVKYKQDFVLSDGSELTVEGYKLLGWTDVKKGAEVKYALGAKVHSLTAKNKKSVVLYPIWQKIE